LNYSKVGNIRRGDQIAFRRADKLVLGTVAGFGYTTADQKLQPYLRLAEFPNEKVLVSEVEKITNRGQKLSKS